MFSSHRARHGVWRCQLVAVTAATSNSDTQLWCTCVGAAPKDGAAWPSAEDAVHDACGPHPRGWGSSPSLAQAGAARQQVYVGDLG